MEKKIGEIFEFGGEWYQCVKSDGTCNGCVGKFQPYSFCNGSNECVGKTFKKLEKVGEPYIIGNKLIQRYKIYPTTYHINVYGWYYQNLDVKSWTIDIEIKQTKEDMEEKKLNLKPFDIQKAREGKPVCTRDGHKARIICFDRNDCKRIVALVQTNSEIESLLECYNDGRVFHSDTNNDLMMLPEKKEGWVNVYNRLGVVSFSHNPYDTKEEALEELKSASGRAYCVDTIKINWEE